MRLPTWAWRMPMSRACSVTAQELLQTGLDAADRNRDGVVADVTLVLDGHVQRDDVAVAQHALERADAVDDLLVDRDADVAPESGGELCW